jgi:hypothetical protein
MAIGSQGEIGVTFGTLKDFDWVAWRAYVRDDLMGGYANIGYPTGYGPKRESTVCEKGNHETD